MPRNATTVMSSLREGPLYCDTASTTFCTSALAGSAGFSRSSCSRRSSPNSSPLLDAGLGDAIGVQQQRVAAAQVDACLLALPDCERAEHGGCGVELYQLAGRAQQQRRNVRAVHVADAARTVS